ncbi:hypothetical protein CNEO3_190019 [Clostridium neonatale]|nr:hypothetical protein CNEO3_160019 [Clostridium neonatale]CAI3567070.1 hypothetical protein CNEO3_190019 [Clostridium neonatale]
MNIQYLVELSISKNNNRLISIYLCINHTIIIKFYFNQYTFSAPDDIWTYHPLNLIIDHILQNFKPFFLYK